MILRLRDRGTTVFFSSHILSDAETLCSRVAIVAAGKLVAIGNLADMVPFRLRGWDLVVSGLTDASRHALVADGATVTQISADRHHVVLRPEATPDRTIARLTAEGATLVSLNPVRDTLEDVFMARVAEHKSRTID
jgi:ABC-2 type transport system ATP-binding protein